MKLFRGNNEVLTPKIMCKYLRGMARDDGTEFDIPPEEHTCWIAADMIEKLVAAIDGKAPEIMLRELADRLEKIEWVDSV